MAKQDKKQMAFYINQSRCTGCCTCVVACKDWHDVPAGPANWIRVKTIEKGKYPNLMVSFMFNPCFHCAEPACVLACPQGAITKRAEDGIVVVARELCLGKEQCGVCKEACPYDSPQFGAEENAKMQKCDFCLDRLEESKPPICVAGCPLRALDAGTIEKMKKKYGEGVEAEGFVYSWEVRPSIVCTPSRHYRASRTKG